MATTNRSRSQTSINGIGCDPFEDSNARTETKLGDNVLKPQFVQELENFYHHASAPDKARCLELIHSLKYIQKNPERLTSQLQRSKTSIPTFGSGSKFNPYQTCYDRDYPPKYGGETKVIRPMTSAGYATTVPISQPMGPTTYEAEFYQKYQRPPSLERAGTSSGHRNNKPHPAQSFLVWKFPSKKVYSEEAEDRISENMTNEKLRQLNKRLYNSVYQSDYLGIPLGNHVSSSFDLPTSWKENVPYGKNSTQRESFKEPQYVQQLAVATTRYGSNIHKQVPAVAAIPTANKRQFGVFERTTYDRHYNENAQAITEDGNDAGQIEEILNKYYKTMSDPVKKQVGVSSNEPKDERNKTSWQSEQINKPEMSSVTTNLQISPVERRLKISSASASRKGSGCSFKSLKDPDTTRPARETSYSCQKSPPVFATSFKLPSQYPCRSEVPTTPLSVPYTPPLFLS